MGRTGAPPDAYTRRTRGETSSPRVQVQESYKNGDSGWCGWSTVRKIGILGGADGRLLEKLGFWVVRMVDRSRNRVLGPPLGAGAPDLHIVVCKKRRRLLRSRSKAAQASTLNSRHHRGSNPGLSACWPSALPTEPWCLLTTVSRPWHRAPPGRDPASIMAHWPTARPRNPPVGGGGGGSLAGEALAKPVSERWGRGNL